MHRNEMRHKGLRRKKKEMACTEKRCFDKKIEFGSCHVQK
jgi:hypothetical protein